MRYGTLPVLITIMRRATDSVNVRGDFVVFGGPLMVSLRQTTGRQQIEAGLPEDMSDVVIRVPVTAATLTITAEDRIIATVSGIAANYAIKTVGLPERRGGYIEIVCTSSISN